MREFSVPCVVFQRFTWFLISTEITMGVWDIFCQHKNKKRGRGVCHSQKIKSDLKTWLWLLSKCGGGIGHEIGDRGRAGLEVEVGVTVGGCGCGSQQMKVHPLHSGEEVWKECTFESDNCKLCKIINFKLTICRPHGALLFISLNLAHLLYLSVSFYVSRCSPLGSFATTDADRAVVVFVGLS